MIYSISHDATEIYTISEILRDQISPARFSMLMTKSWFDNLSNPFYDTYFGSVMRSSFDIAERMSRLYKKPKFGITKCLVDGKEQEVKIKIISKAPFCRLLNFKKIGYKKHQPNLLIVAPMSGHHATLLRHTVEDMLPFFNVYITDWIDPKQVPITDGSFDLDDFIDYITDYIKIIPNAHVMAVCQPTVPVLAASAIMFEQNDLQLPKSLILIGGPIDARKNPTKPSNFAIDKNLIWFDKALITRVPENYPGYRRRIYPGFIQLISFLSMNWQKHMQSHIQLFRDLIDGNDEQVLRHKKFYDEYFSFMDLPAEFYLQTIKEVFHDFSLAKGSFKSRGRKVRLGAITNCALMGIEGENDDIAAVGQTKAALSLCRNIPDSKKAYYLQKGVGHYGAFSGGSFRNHIAPRIKEFVYAND